MDEGLHAALPKEYASLWDDLSPTGRASPVFHATRSTAEDRQLDIELILNGQLGVTCRPFPGRVEDVFGRIYMSGGTVHIDQGEPVRARAEPMRCTIYGDITNLFDPPANMNIIIEVSGIPLNDAKKWQSKGIEVIHHGAESRPPPGDEDMDRPKNESDRQ